MNKQDCYIGQYVRIVKNPHPHCIAKPFSIGIVVDSLPLHPGCIEVVCKTNTKPEIVTNLWLHMDWLTNPGNTQASNKVGKFAVDILVAKAS